MIWISRRRPGKASLIGSIVLTVLYAIWMTAFALSTWNTRDASKWMCVIVIPVQLAPFVILAAGLVHRHSVND
jgi:biotin transporter BioY